MPWRPRMALRARPPGSPHNVPHSVLGNSSRIKNTRSAPLGAWALARWRPSTGLETVTSNAPTSSAKPTAERRTAIGPPMPELPLARGQMGRKKLEPWPVNSQMLVDVVSMFNTLPMELDYWVDKAWVTGTIPKELQGTYMRNGPGLQVSTGKHQRHFMDGDGCVLSLAFPGNGAPPRFTNKYVRTQGFVDEQIAGKPMYRNAFTRGAADGSPLFNPLDLNFKNVANTGVLYWADRLWALWEVGKPHELRPGSLETIGESSMDGQVGQRVAAHYRTTTEPDGSQRAVMFGAQVSFTGMYLDFFEMDESGKVVARAQHTLKKGWDIMFVHDMLVTEHWYIVILGPVQLDLKGFLSDYLLGKRALAELLIYNKDMPSKIYMYARPGKTPPAGSGQQTSKVIDAPPFFSFHHVNAYERAEGAEVVLDTISWQDVAFDVTHYTVTEGYYQGGCRSQLFRLVLDVASSSMVSCEQVTQRTLEFPAYNTAAVTGKPYQHAYFSGDAVDHPVLWAPAQALIKLTIPDPPATAKPRPQRSEPPQSNSSRPAAAQQHKASPVNKHPAAGSAATGAAQDKAQGARANNVVAFSRQGSAHKQGSAGHMMMDGVECSEWRPGKRCFTQEPMFVPRPGATAEDDGWIIMGVHNAETLKGEIAILDAQRISDGPLAVIHLPHALPYGLHGAWTPAYLGPDPHDPNVPRWRTPVRIKQL